MKVITEETIRRQFHSKQLREGTEFLIDATYLLTPSAQSYLREHHIQVINRNETKSSTSAQLTTYENEPIQQLLSEKKEKQNNLLVQLEISHLINLLYFPLLNDDSLTVNWWLFFEQQQEWLKTFASGKGKSSDSIEHVVDSEFRIKIENFRVWLFSFNELKDQLTKIQNLLENKTTSQRFKNWSEQFLKVIQSPKKDEEMS